MEQNEMKKIAYHIGDIYGKHQTTIREGRELSLYYK